VAAPGLSHSIVPSTLVIITVLFAVQRYGTGASGRAFGPVMGHLVRGPRGGRPGRSSRTGILRAIRRPDGWDLPRRPRPRRLASLWVGLLTISGAEALYADMGHFGRSPIRRAWFAIVFPALILNYMGQGALILTTPAPSTTLLPALPALGADADGPRRHRRHGDRLAGRHLRGLLGHRQAVQLGFCRA
jgi:KUP system potassium uptake protein